MAAATENDRIIQAIIATFGFGTIFAFASSWFISNWLIWIISIGVYLIAHPIIGRVWCWIVEGLGNAIDSVYFGKGTEWGKWSKTSRITFAAFWPVTGPVGFMLFLIGLVYGLIFKNIFRE